MDQLDKIITDIVTKKISEPIEYENKIKNVLKKDPRIIKKNSFIEKAAILVIGVTMIGGVVFAKQISNVIKNIPNKNINTTIKDDYIQNLNMEYKTFDNLSIKIDSIVVDDFNIQLYINYLYNRPITSAESKIQIKDENNNLIFKIDDFELINYREEMFRKENRHKYGEFVVNDEIALNDTESNKQMQQSQFTTNYKSLYQNITNNNLNRILDLYTDIDSKKFPESKKLYIQLEGIVLRNEQNTVKEIDKKWEFEIKLNEKFLNRKNTIYVQEDENKGKTDFKILKTEASHTKFKIKMIYQGEQDLKQVIDVSNLETIQIFNEKCNEYINAETIEIENNNIIKLSYSIDADKLSDKLLIKVGGNSEIEIIKDKFW